MYHISWFLIYFKYLLCALAFRNITNISRDYMKPEKKYQKRIIYKWSFLLRKKPWNAQSLKILSWWLGHGLVLNWSLPGHNLDMIWLWLGVGIIMIDQYSNDLSAWLCIKMFSIVRLIWTRVRKRRRNMWFLKEMAEAKTQTTWQTDKMYWEYFALSWFAKFNV